MISITSEAARELLELAEDGGPRVLKFDAQPDGAGSLECSVALVAEAPDDALVEEISGVTVAFCGSSEAIFASAVVSLTAEGELTVDLAQGDCGDCSHGCCGCGDESCGPEESGR